MEAICALAVSLSAEWPVIGRCLIDKTNLQRPSGKNEPEMSRVGYGGGSHFEVAETGAMDSGATGVRIGGGGRSRVVQCPKRLQNCKEYG